MISELQGSSEIVPRGSAEGRLPVRAAGPTLQFCVPACDREEFDQLPESVRLEIVSLLGIFGAASRARKMTRIFRAQARPGRSVKTLQRKWADFQNAGGDWRALINGAKVPTGRGLAPEFIEFVQGFLLRNKRGAQSQYRKLIRFWQQGCDDKGKRFAV